MTDAKPVAFMFRLANSVKHNDDGSKDWLDFDAVPRLSFTEPVRANGSVKDLAPLYSSEAYEAVERELDRLKDAEAAMACGVDDEPMTAAEEVLAWLLIEKIGVPDDVTYSPNQAQQIIERAIEAGQAAERERDEAQAEVKRLVSLLQKVAPREPSKSWLSTPDYKMIRATLDEIEEKAR